MHFRVLAVAAAILLAGPAAALDEVTFGTNWLAEAEHGGFYQALADGTYEKYGLAVTIRQGGPRVANRALLTGGQIQLYMGGQTSAIDALQAGLPTLTLAAIFQKDPQILMTHPDAGFTDFADLANASKYILSQVGYISYFAWMKSVYPGFVDEKYVVYNFSSAGFIADPRAIQQGYVTSEPLAIERETGWAPQVFLLADHGFAPYSTTIEVMRPWYDANRDVTKRFVEASIIGWYTYLYGDSSAADTLIKAENPEMTDDQLAFGRAKMKQYGIAVSGDAEAGGIGCMTAARWQGFYEQMQAIGLFAAGLDMREAYTTELVCHGLGKELVR